MRKNIAYATEFNIQFFFLQVLNKRWKINFP